MSEFDTRPLGTSTPSEHSTGWNTPCVPEAPPSTPAVSGAAAGTLGYATLPDMQAWARGIMQRDPDYVIGDNYLRRWWVLPRNEQLNVYLHEICHSDDDRAMHDHPWANTSYLLFGTYVEHTPEGVFVRKAGDLIERSAGDLHRLEVVPGERAISLFITGPKVREWGFKCDHGWVHWADFTNPENTGRIGRGCGEHDSLTPTSELGRARQMAEPSEALGAGA